MPTQRRHSSAKAKMPMMAMATMMGCLVMLLASFRISFALNAK